MVIVHFWHTACRKSMSIFVVIPLEVDSYESKFYILFCSLCLLFRLRLQLGLGLGFNYVSKLQFTVLKAQDGIG